MIKAVRERERWITVELERAYEAEDPWQYRAPLGQRRFMREIQLIDSVASRGAFSSALEIGCGEGQFTKRLATRCHELVAVDMNDTALGRARHNCAHLPNVTFRTWDLRKDALLGRFDLVVAVGVLEYMRNPSALREARSKLVSSVSEGGWLLVGNVQQHEIIERARWDRLFLRGAKHINAYVTSHPSLERVSEAGGDGYLEVLLFKSKVP